MTTAAFTHTPIMVAEVLQLLQPERGGIFVDCTLGGGGHADEVLKRLPEGSKLIGIDRDEDAIAAASRKLLVYKYSFIPYRGNFFEIKHILRALNIQAVDGILMDLGVSSYQLDTAARGFSYNEDAPLDMRMDTNASFSAFDVVNGYDADRLTRVIRDYGEERFARRIAVRITEKRELAPIKTTGELVQIIKDCIPAPLRREGPHPAKRTFQALRIEVNQELEGLTDALKAAHSMLNLNGRMAVITFHSLEDRIVKQTFRELENPCTCPHNAPICVCGKLPAVKLITKKPITPSEQELLTNPRARSAKLRGVIKI